MQYAELNKYYATEEYLTTFHSDEYIDLIRNVTPENRNNYEDQLYRFNFKEDCPVMERLYDYCVSYTTGSIGTRLPTQPLPDSWPKESSPTASTGRAGSTTPNSLKHRDSATSMTVSSPSSNSSRCTSEYYTSTSTSTTETGRRRRST